MQPTSKTIKLVEDAQKVLLPTLLGPHEQTILPRAKCRRGKSADRPVGGNGRPATTKVLMLAFGRHEGNSSEESKKFLCLWGKGFLRQGFSVERIKHAKNWKNIDV